MKKGIAIGIIVVCISYLWTAHLFMTTVEDAKTIEGLRCELNVLYENNRGLIRQLDSVEAAIGTVEVVYHARDFRTKDLFSLFKVGNGRGYQVLTDLKGFDREAFDFVYWTCVEAGVDIPFLLHVLWTESRFGTNVEHKLNYDGSIDGGWFGLNSKYHPIKSVGNPYKDVFLFIEYYNENIRPYPKWQANARYKYGWKKAKELGLI